MIGGVFVSSSLVMLVKATFVLNSGLIFSPFLVLVRDKVVPEIAVLSHWMWKPGVMQKVCVKSAGHVHFLSVNARSHLCDTSGIDIVIFI